jgi:DNA ligase 4
MKCYSFFKVGGGFKAEDYASIRHHTEGKWIDWDSKHPPTEFIELGGGDLQYERPDVWIKPCDSVVVSVKAASVGSSDQFRMGFTLRFPRFKRLRMDRSWDTALSIQDFSELKARVEEEYRDKEFKLDMRHKVTKKLKKSIVIAGNEQDLIAPYAEPETQLFGGLNFCILSEGLKPVKKSKAELEQIVKANGGKIFQSPTATDDIICITDKKVVKAASMMKSGTTNIVRPAWILDALNQCKADVGKPTFVLPFEAGHMFFTKAEDEEHVKKNVDEFGDSYARDVDVDELRRILENMGILSEDGFDVPQFLEDLHNHDHDMSEVRGWLFRGVRAFVDSSHDWPEEKASSHMSASDLRMRLASNLIRFAGGKVVADLEDEGVTHVVVDASSPKLHLLRKEISERRRLPRMVTAEWVEESWNERTLLDEERYTPIGR